MTTLYKLTSAQGQTRGQTQWGPGIEHTASGEGPLCGPGHIHAYTDPLLAVLLNPIHARFTAPLLWEADGDVAQTDSGLKVGCTRLRTLRKIPVPEISLEQRIEIAIRCALAVYPEPNFAAWAEDWLSGQDRSAEAAEARAAAAGPSARAAAARAAARAAAAGGPSARAAALAAAAGPSARAAEVAAWAAEEAAARAAALEAAEIESTFDLVAIVHQVVDRASVT